jgi:hypothetical protein
MFCRWAGNIWCSAQMANSLLGSWGDSRLRLSVARRATTLARTNTKRAKLSLLGTPHLSFEFPPQGTNTAASAAGQPKAAVSTKCFNSP